MEKLKNLLRSKFISAILVILVMWIKAEYLPNLPEEAIYGLLGYLGFEAIRDIIIAFKSK